jgi:nucleotide-binding universal stress UspA family protein
MKTILVPTDFSSASSSAVDYAAEIARFTKAELILLHVYPLPVMPTETLAILPVTDIENGCMEGLHNIEKELQGRYDNKLHIRCTCMGGFVPNEINVFIEANNIDLVVMGTHGTGNMIEKLAGSNTGTLLRKAKCPVLAIHENIKFKQPRRILLASGYSDSKKQTLLEPLKELAALFKSHVYILNVVPQPETIPTREQAITGIKLDHSLEAFNHSFHDAVNEHVIEGINTFATENEIDVIVMIPHTHNVIERLLHEPNTKHIAFHTQFPILALH